MAPVSARCVKTSQGISSATGSAPSRQHFLERARDQRRRGVGIFDPVGPFHEGSQRRELIRHFVQMAAALAEKCVGTCPVRQSTGSFDPNAVSNAAPALSTPGPGTTLNTPGLPVDRA